MLKEGMIVGERYEIISRIGSGGMADVYKAKDHKLNRLVAVKVMKAEFSQDKGFISKFRKEAQAAAGLAHPNVVNVYDVGEDNGIYYIVMELVQGITLKDYITRKGKLSVREATSIAIQVSLGLEAAHKSNIVHRDVKPQNIIISMDGKVKVTDFGIAKAVSNSTITAFGTTIGSVHYFSPEHARGGFTDAKSDLYSLGVVMYEMVTGRVPFDADTPVSVALKHMQEQPEEPIEVNPNVPIAINKIIMRALQKDTTLRYQTATEMLTDLRKALKNPNGDFVDDKEYDPTAATQIINTEMYNNVKNRDNEEQAENGKTDNKLKRFIKKHKKLSIFIGLILLFSLSLGGTILALNITNPPEVNIPNVVGMAKDEAQREVENEKLKFSIEKEEYNKDVPEGFIISQKVDGDTIGDFTTTPSTDRKVKEGTTIKVIVSKGQEKTTVPKVIGMKQDEAIKALEDANLKAEVIEETSKKVEEGYVISQETDANAEAYAGDTVKIHVSTGTGIKQVTVVSVIGQDEATAKKTLTDLGLKVNITYADSKSDNGKVAKQSLDSGKVVDEGTTITLTVNKVAESKNVTVNINVKAITGGYTENANETETTSKKVNIKVNNETRTGIDKNKSDFSITLSGKDGESGQITVVITDPTSGATLYSSSKTITYGSQDAVSFN